MFCSVCRHAVTGLFKLREEVEDIEARIRAVSKLRNQEEKTKDHDPLPFSLQNPDLSFPHISFICKSEPESDEDEEDVDHIKSEPLSPVQAEGQQLESDCDPVKVPNKMTCPICKKYCLTAEKFKSHTHPDKDDPLRVTYTCDTCGKGLSTMRNLRDHKSQVHQDKEDKRLCPTCGKVFQSTKSFLRHSKTCIKEGTKCHCGKVFESPLERLDHERVFHEGLSTLKCYFCSKTLSHVGHLPIHMRTHTCERPYDCPKCGKDFAHESSLKCHSVTVCSNDRDEIDRIRVRDREYRKVRGARLPYPCELCDKRFREKPPLMNHKRREHEEC